MVTRSYADLKCLNDGYSSGSPHFLHVRSIDGVYLCAKTST